MHHPLASSAEPSHRPEGAEQVYVMNNVRSLQCSGLFHGNGEVHLPSLLPHPPVWKISVGTQRVEFYLVASHSPQQSGPHTRHALLLGRALHCKVVGGRPAWKSENQRKEVAC